MLGSSRKCLVSNGGVGIAGTDASCRAVFRNRPHALADRAAGGDVEEGGAMGGEEGEVGWGDVNVAREETDFVGGEGENAAD